jgi:biotin carboxyl carrier protein
MSQYNLKINGKEYNVCVDSVKGDHAEVTVNGKKYEVEISRPKAEIEIPSRPAQSDSEDAARIRRPSRKKAASAGLAVESPLDGNILSVNVKVGDMVRSGQAVAILEAMKMENEIQAEYDGTVTAVNVAKGDHVSVGESIITIG